MCSAAKEGRHLADLVVDAAALCKAANDRLQPHAGPGRPETFEQWQIAVLIVIAIAHGRKSKSSQWRYLAEHATSLLRDFGMLLKLNKLPSRATYMRRYGAARKVFELAIKLGGREALVHHVADASVVAVDKSLIPAQGRVRPPSWQRRKPRNVDLQAGWGKSAYDGWVWGYSYEVVVCAGKHGRIVPLLASASTANVNEHRSFAGKIRHLPPSAKYVLGDGGYDGNALAEAIEYTARGRRTGKHLLTPLLPRGGRPAVGRTQRRGKREQIRQHRIRRDRFANSVRGKRLYERRKCTVEPFNGWLKERFGLQHSVWHRGLANNQTALLASIFLYQSLQRHNAACGHKDGAVQWILDAL